MKVVLNKCFGGANLSKEAGEFIKSKIPDFDFEKDVLPRHHPILVECVETLGNKASGRNSSLVVVEVPYNKYVLEEYDGMETISSAEEIIIDSSNLEYKRTNDLYKDRYWFIPLDVTDAVV